MAAAPAFAAPANWSGPYVGVTAGAAWGDAKASTTALNTSYFAASSVTSIAANGKTTLKPSGFNGGAVAGYNHQNGHWVFGGEASFDAMDLNKGHVVAVTYPCCAPSIYTISQSVKTNWLFTARPKLGWANDNWMVYGTAGLAVTDLHYGEHFSDNFFSPGAAENGSKSSTRTGWTAGAGAEFKAGAHWSVKAEYLYADFGSISSTKPITLVSGVASLHHTVDLKTNLLRVGINWRF